MESPFFDRTKYEAKERKKKKKRRRDGVTKNAVHRWKNNEEETRGQETQGSSFLLKSKMHRSGNFFFSPTA